MKAATSSQPWGALLAVCAGIVGVSLALTAWLHLSPCHLCIVQRLLFMLMALAAAIAWSGRALGARIERVGASLFIGGALLGIATAGYQSWLQMRPGGLFSCAGGQPGLIERLVEWLGQQVPWLFMAGGLCEDKELVILGLSLANWALLAYALTGGVALWAAWRRAA